MEKKIETTSKATFAVNATASLDFNSGSIDEEIRPPSGEKAAEQSEKSISVSQASLEALKILENQGFGRSINAAAQSLLENGFISPSSPLVTGVAPTTAAARGPAKQSRGLNSASVSRPAPGTAAHAAYENNALAPAVAEYMDYRKLLHDFYQFRREQSKNQLRPYSYSTFAAAANIKSPNYLKMIIEGKRNLSPEMIGRFAKAMGLNKADSDQFRMLVTFNQSTEPAQRNLLLKELSEMRVERQLEAGEIDRKAWDRLPSWVAWVLYALFDQAGVEFKVDKLRDVLRGKAKPDEIEAALKSLVESGEVTYDPATGAYAKAKNRSENPEEIPVALIRKLQAQLMLLGLESLYQDSPTDREFGTLTVALTQSEFEELRFKLRQIRKQVHKDISIQRMSAPGERVYQLNLQLFPVTDKQVPTPTAD